jgi:hypothetical protein
MQHTIERGNFCCHRYRYVYHNMHIYIKVARWYIFRRNLPIWVNFDIFSMDDAGIFHGHFVFLWPFCIFCCHFVHFSCFGMLHKKKLATLNVLLLGGGVDECNLRLSFAQQKGTTVFFIRCFFTACCALIIYDGCARNNAV